MWPSLWLLIPHFFCQVLFLLRPAFEIGIIFGKWPQDLISFGNPYILHTHVHTVQWPIPYQCICVVVWPEWFRNGPKSRGKVGLWVVFDKEHPLRAVPCGRRLAGVLIGRRRGQFVVVFPTEAIVGVVVDVVQWIFTWKTHQGVTHIICTCTKACYS